MHELLSGHVIGQVEGHLAGNELGQQSHMVRDVNQLDWLYIEHLD